MPLNIDRQITSIELPLPDSDTEGYDVSQFAAALLTISELNDVSDWSMGQYAVVDDQTPVPDSDPPRTVSTYPDGVIWPEIDTLRITRFNTAHLLVPLVGVQRWRPVLTGWTDTGPSPSVHLRGKFLHAGAVASLASLGALQALTVLDDQAVARIVSLAQDFNAPVDWAKLTTIDAEVADVIRVNLQAADQASVALPWNVRFRLQLIDTALVPFTTAAFTMAVPGPGSASTLIVGAPAADVYAITDLDTGLAHVDITDVVGASGAVVVLDVRARVHLDEGLITFIVFD